MANQLFEIDGFEALNKKLKQLPDNVKRTEVLKIQRRLAKPILSAKEDEDGRLLPVNTVKFIIRWIEDIMVNGSKYFIRDYDGDYLISGVIEVAGPMRRRFIEIQATRRG